MPLRITPPSPRQRAARGFSLIEVMLGILLGMFAVIAVLKVFSQSDTAQRIGNSSGEAQVNATVALDMLSREIRQAGQSLNSLKLLGCALSIGTTSQTFVVAPVVINDTTVVPAGDANTDTLLVMSGNYGGSPEGDTITTGSNSISVTTANAFAAGDYLVQGATSATALAGTECTLNLQKVSSVSGNTVNLTKVGSGSSSDTSAAYNLGAGLSIHAYAVRKGNLTMCDYMVNDCSTGTDDATVWVPVASQVVSLRAQYGKADAGTALDTRTLSSTAPYDQSTPSGSSSSTAQYLYCQWAHVMALRLAVVGRGASKQRPTTSGSTTVYATPSSPTWDGSDDLAIDLSKLTDWQDYRYRVMQATVPLRNMLWVGATSC